MLERLALVIGPHCQGSQGTFRPVYDGDSQLVLGHVFRNPPETGRWLENSRPRRETVCETPDGSLLCVVRREWWFGDVQVLDAEQQLIGLVRRRLVMATDGRVLAQRQSSNVPNEQIYRTVQGIEIASIVCDGQTHRLGFHPRIGNEPLIKMALLAAVLFL